VPFLNHYNDNKGVLNMGTGSLIEFYGRVWATFYQIMLRDDRKNLTSDQILQEMRDIYNCEAEIYGFDKIE
jgi:hypothetical protein